MKKDEDPNEEQDAKQSADPKKKSKREPKPDTTAVAAELEHLVTVAFAAINDRNWPYLLSPESHIAPFVSMGASGMRPSANSQAKMIADFQALVEDYPDYRLHIVSMSTQVYENVSAAEVFANCEVTGGPGVPVGMSRKTVSCFEFQRIDGVWMAVRDTTIPGGGEDRGGFGGEMDMGMG